MQHRRQTRLHRSVGVTIGFVRGLARIFSWWPPYCGMARGQHKTDRRKIAMLAALSETSGSNSTQKLETASRRAGGNDVRVNDTKSLLNYDRGPLVRSLPESATALE